MGAMYQYFKYFNTDNMVLEFNDEHLFSLMLSTVYFF